MKYKTIAIKHANNCIKTKVLSKNNNNNMMHTSKIRSQERRTKSNKLTHCSRIVNN